MTLQIPDTVIFRPSPKLPFIFARVFSYLWSSKYELIRFGGKGFFNPFEFGVTPRSDEMSCCWNGYITTYEIKNNSIFLKDLEINLSRFSGDCEIPQVHPPEINGVKPTSNFSSSETAHENTLQFLNVKPRIRKNISLFEFSYQEINLLLNFSGVILIGSGWIKGTDFLTHPFLAYKNVLALMFRKGEMSSQFDLSKDAFFLRKKIEGKNFEEQQHAFHTAPPHVSFFLDYFWGNKFLEGPGPGKTGPEVPIPVLEKPGSPEQS